MDLSYFTTSDYVGGGVLITLFATSLTILWERYKNHEDDKEKQKVTVMALVYDLDSNLKIGLSIVGLMTNELQILNHGNRLVDSIPKLKTGYWDYLKYNMPLVISRNIAVINQLRDIDSVCTNINDSIDSREAYRINNGAMSNFIEMMTLYDNIILQKSMDCTTKIKQLEAVVKVMIY